MKKILILSSAIILSLSSFTTGDGDKIPSATVKKLDGSTANSGTFSNDGKPMIISFWATWCLPCLEELGHVSEKLPDWKTEKDFNFVALSIDDPRTAQKVKTMINGKGWEFDQVLLDPSQSIKRQLNVNNVPTTLVYYKGKLVYSHVGFAPGDEVELFEKIKALQ